MSATQTFETEERAAMPLNPFMPLTRNAIDLAAPKGRNGVPQDYYTWVVYFLDGQWAAEYDARGEQYGFAVVGERPVLAIDLIPIQFDCPKHQKRAREDCPYCLEMWRRGRLSMHRLIVPPEKRAVMFRRRFDVIGDLPEGIEIVQCWTVIGYEDLTAKKGSMVGLDGATLVDGELRGHYLFLDESGRSLITADRNIV